MAHVPEKFQTEATSISLYMVNHLLSSVLYHESPCYPLISDTTKRLKRRQDLRVVCWDNAPKSQPLFIMESHTLIHTISNKLIYVSTMRFDQLFKPKNMYDT